MRVMGDLLTTSQRQYLPIFSLHLWLSLFIEGQIVAWTPTNIWYDLWLLLLDSGTGHHNDDIVYLIKKKSDLNEQNLLTRKQFLSSNRRSPCLWWEVAKLNLLSETLLVCGPTPSSINIYPSIFHDWPLHHSDIFTEKVFNSSFPHTNSLSFGSAVVPVCVLSKGVYASHF